MKPKVVEANQYGLWAVADPSLARALEAVARTGWPQHHSDKLLARTAFDSWLRDSRPRDQPDPQLLGDLIRAALAGL